MFLFRRRTKPSDGGAPYVRAVIAGEIVERSYDGDRPPEDDVEREPVPGPRPHQRAQWDEAAGVWIEWDDADHEWEPVDDADPDDGGGDADDSGTSPPRRT